MQQLGRTLVLIPTARLVGPELQGDLGAIPPVLARIGGKLLLELIIEALCPGLGATEVVCTVDEAEELVRMHLARSALCRSVRLVKVDAAQPLGVCVRDALRSLDVEQYERLVINFGDTICAGDSVPQGTAIFYDELNESYRWTTFAVRNGCIVDIADKDVQDSVCAQPVFTGLFYLAAPSEFLAALENQPAESNTNKKVDLFYRALQTYLAGRNYTLVKAAQWQDFGHIDTYYAARRHHLNARYFNRFQADEVRPIVRKTSSHTAKLLDEITWYLDIPAGLRCYIPQILDYSKNSAEPFLCMEYYGYPNLGDLYLAAAHDLAVWHHALGAIFHLLADMQGYRLAGAEGVREVLHKMYVQKTIERLEMLRENSVLSHFYDEPAVINGKEHPPLGEICLALPALVHQAGLLEGCAPTVVHGDFCLANLLYDPKNRIIKMLDPRGSFPACSIYGDCRYDLAKLSHSFNGGYELIINDCFEVMCEGNNIDFRCERLEKQKRISAMFNKLLTSHYPGREHQVRMIEALLFLSMIPLHRDFPHRQLAMLATGLNLLSGLRLGTPAFTLHATPGQVP